MWSAEKCVRAPLSVCAPVNVPSLPPKWLVGNGKCKQKARQNIRSYPGLQHSVFKVNPFPFFLSFCCSLALLSPLSSTVTLTNIPEATFRWFYSRRTLRSLTPTEKWMICNLQCKIEPCRLNITPPHSLKKTRLCERIRACICFRRLLMSLR